MPPESGGPMTMQRGRINTASAGREHTTTPPRALPPRPPPPWPRRRPPLPEDGTPIANSSSRNAVSIDPRLISCTPNSLLRVASGCAPKTLAMWASQKNGPIFGRGEVLRSPPGTGLLHFRAGRGVAADVDSAYEAGLLQLHHAACGAYQLLLYMRIDVALAQRAGAGNLGVLREEFEDLRPG
jgi:hypothetical protein